jgi:integrase
LADFPDLFPWTVISVLNKVKAGGPLRARQQPERWSGVRHLYCAGRFAIGGHSHKRLRPWFTPSLKGEWKLLILFAYFTGARLCDCCRMQWDGVGLAGETLTCQQAKTGAKVTTPLHPDLLKALNKLAGTDKPDVFIMPKLAGQRGSGRRGLSETFKNIMRKAGVDSQTVKGAGNQMFSKRSFHALRHSFTSALANQNVSSELRMKLTGHKTEGEHQKYTHLEMDNLRAAVQKIRSLG